MTCYAYDVSQDTLLRCAKLEVRKRKLDEQEGQLERLYQRSLQSKYDVAEDADEDGEEEEDEQDDEEDQEYDDEVSTGIL